MTAHDDLILEVREQDDLGPLLVNGLAAITITPPVDEDYWTYRVRVADGQAVVGFPKFSTIGVGFAVEEDWNTNLPYTCTAEQIADHIGHNAGNPEITRERTVAAVRLIQDRAHADRGTAPGVSPYTRVQMQEENL